MRLVVDASVVVDLIGRFRPGPVEALLFAPNTAIAAPALLDVEVLQALRKLDLQGVIPPSRHDLIDILQGLRIRRYPHASLMEGIWALRAQITAYDAAYVVLARQLDATLITRDARLARAPGLGIEIFAP
jgi:predicted nucleic acid-binding protein